MFEFGAKTLSNFYQLNLEWNVRIWCGKVIKWLENVTFGSSIGLSQKLVELEARNWGFFAGTVAEHFFCGRQSFSSL